MVLGYTYACLEKKIVQGLVRSKFFGGTPDQITGNLGRTPGDRTGSSSLWTNSPTPNGCCSLKQFTRRARTTGSRFLKSSQTILSLDDQNPTSTPQYAPPLHLNRAIIIRMCSGMQLDLRGHDPCCGIRYVSVHWSYPAMQLLSVWSSTVNDNAKPRGAPSKPMNPWHPA